MVRLDNVIVTKANVEKEFPVYTIVNNKTLVIVTSIRVRMLFLSTIMSTFFSKANRFYSALGIYIFFDGDAYLLLKSKHENLMSIKKFVLNELQLHLIFCADKPH